jgi:hypothetical protein
METVARAAYFETTGFPVVRCAGCGNHTIAARDLDEDDAWILTCTGCGHVHGKAEAVNARSLGASTLTYYGYEIENELPAAGCGEGGGCGSCSSGSCG